MTLDQLRGDEASSERQLRRHVAFLRHHGWAVATPLLYLAVSIWLYFPLAQHLRSAQMGGPDTSLFTWWLSWVPYAISHGHSPFVSTWINAPAGVNGMWNTSVPLLGLLVSPITETLGPVASVNLLLIAAPALSAWSAFAAARALGLRNRSAFLAGFLYGFSTAILAQDASGHLHLSMAVFPPLAVVLLHRTVAGTITARRGGPLVGLTVALQVWTSEEVLAMGGLLTALTLAVLAVRARRDLVGPAIRRLAPAAGWALLVAVPLTAPALVVQFLGQGHLTSAVGIPHLSADPLTAIVPTHQVLVHRLVSAATIRRIQDGSYGEITGYVGLPVVVLLLLSRRRIRGTGLRWCWTPLVIAFVLSLGWTVQLAGTSLDPPGPERITAKLPLLSSILMPRFSVYVVLFAALLAGAAWDTATGARSRRWTEAMVGLGVLAVLPWPSAHITRITVPAAFAAGRPLPGYADGATMAALPWPSSLDADAMRWQAIDRQHFKLLGAWGIVAGNGGVGDYGTPIPLLDKVARHLSGRSDDTPPVGGREEAILLRELRGMSTKAQGLIIGPRGDSARVAAYFGGLLHETPVHTGGIYLLRLPG
jgi:hypothetical protein